MPTTGRTRAQVLKLKGRKSWPQIISFKKDKWSKAGARSWLKMNGYYYGTYESRTNEHWFYQYDAVRWGARTRSRKFGKGIRGIFQFYGKRP